METKKTKTANLENKKMLFREIGIALSLLLVLAAFEWGTKEKTTSILIDDRKVIDESDIAITMDTPPSAAEVRVPTITDVFIITDDPTDAPTFIPTEFTAAPVDIRPYTPTVIEEEPIIDDIPAPLVEEKPKFMGGDENEFTKWVFSKLVYPETPKIEGIQGRVTVQFVIDATGRLVDVKVLRGVDPALDKEAVRVISSSPKWEPGRQRGKAVRVKYIFPVIFQLR